MHCIKEVAFHIGITHFTTPLHPGVAYGKLRNSRGHVVFRFANHRRSAFFIPHFTLRITQFRILPIAQFQYTEHKAGLVLCILKLAIHRAGEISP